MKLILTDDDDVVLDTTEVTRDEWEQAGRSSYVAQSILMALLPGEDAQ